MGISAEQVRIQEQFFTRIWWQQHFWKQVPNCLHCSTSHSLFNPLGSGVPNPNFSCHSHGQHPSWPIPIDPSVLLWLLLGRTWLWAWVQWPCTHSPTSPSSLAGHSFSVCFVAPLSYSTSSCASCTLSLSLSLCFHPFLQIHLSSKYYLQARLPLRVPDTHSTVCLRFVWIVNRHLKLNTSTIELLILEPGPLHKTKTKQSKKKPS